MPSPEQLSAPSRGGPPKARLVGPVIAAAAATSIGYWLFQTWMHARLAGVPFARELVSWPPPLAAERIAFIAVVVLFAAFVLRLAQREHHRWDRAVRETDLKRVAVTANIQEHIILHDRTLTALWANKAAGDSVGLTPEEVVGRHCYELWHQRTEPCLVCPVLTAMETGTQQTNELMTPDGRWFYIKGYPVRDEGGKITGAVEITLEITERKRAEEALAREKEQLAVTLASIGDGVVATDPRGSITFLNRAAEKLTGWTRFEALGRRIETVFKLIDERTRMPREDPLDAVRQTGMPSSLPPGTILISRDGTERLIADSGAPIKDTSGKMIGVIFVFRDITEKQQLEREILKSQKLESLSVLAGGIAHDFNNFLTAIIGNASLARMSLGAQDKTYAVLADIEKAAIRARKLTQQLLTFAKGGVPVKKITSLTEIIRDTVRFALSGSNVSCVFDLPDDLWSVDADAEQIGHAINNIVINAREAMPQGGAITVRGENEVLDEDTTLPLPPQKYVKISIRDTGVGIAPEQLGRIFDPYFSTKEQLHSGLGLAVAYFVVKKHGGHIAVDSEPDVATTFSIYLPAAPDRRAAETDAESATPTRGHGRILVMDDEELVLGVLDKILERFGYEVECAKDGMEAIERYRSAMDAGRPFDAVIMDLTVTGGMGGREAIEILRLVDPDVKAIVSSGYSDDPVMADYRAHGFVGVIAKPFRADELSKTLGRILARRTIPTRWERDAE
jgi:two-component system cell cycle sensor histidine kinase/response regulator CckA